MCHTENIASRRQRTDTRGRKNLHTEEKDHSKEVDTGRENRGVLRNPLIPNRESESTARTLPRSMKGYGNTKKEQREKHYQITNKNYERSNDKRTKDDS